MGGAGGGARGGGGGGGGGGGAFVKTHIQKRSFPCGQDNSK